MVMTGKQGNGIPMLVACGVCRRPQSISRPPPPVSRPKEGNPTGAEPPWSSGRESRGNRLEIGSLWRFLSPLSLAAKKEARRRRRNQAAALQRQTANPQNAWRIARCGGDSPHQSPSVAAVSLRLGHAAALTCPRQVIHSSGVASLPQGKPIACGRWTRAGTYLSFFGFISTG